ncbi:STAS domain-containing protein [Kitasatospora sp. NPDC085879]|uniref:STAS domain-containing protein n=1 Tax=Kitasatospora sp. NPDC085879 TaxID=3154769 RepID=UPI0034421F0A
MDADTAAPGGPAGADQLTVSVDGSAGRWVLRLVGELDHDSARPFREALDRTLADTPGLVVVECSGLSFCDSTGLNLLLRARLSALARGGEVVLAAPTAMVQRMLQITGAREIFRVFDSAAEAGPEPGGDG